MPDPWAGPLQALPWEVIPSTRYAAIVYRIIAEFEGRSVEVAETTMRAVAEEIVASHNARLKAGT